MTDLDWARDYLASCPNTTQELDTIFDEENAWYEGATDEAMIGKLAGEVARLRTIALAQTIVLNAAGLVGKRVDNVDTGE